MKTSINNKDITIFIPKETIDFNIKDQKEIEMFLKDKIVKLKRKYLSFISGFYKANVYQNNNYGLIIELIHESDIDFLKDIIDIKVNMFIDSEIFIEVSDYFLLNNKKNIYYYNNKYYININELSYLDIIKLSEFSKYIYGNKLLSIKNQFKVLN